MTGFTLSLVIWKQLMHKRGCLVICLDPGCHSLHPYNDVFPQTHLVSVLLRNTQLHLIIMALRVEVETMQLHFLSHLNCNGCIIFVYIRTYIEMNMKITVRWVNFQLDDNSDEARVQRVRGIITMKNHTLPSVLYLNTFRAFPLLVWLLHQYPCRSTALTVFIRHRDQRAASLQQGQSDVEM